MNKQITINADVEITCDDLYNFITTMSVEDERELVERLCMENINKSTPIQLMVFDIIRELTLGSNSSTDFTERLVEFVSHNFMKRGCCNSDTSVCGKKTVSVKPKNTDKKVFKCCVTTGCYNINGNPFVIRNGDIVKITDHNRTTDAYKIHVVNDSCGMLDWINDSELSMLLSTGILKRVGGYNG